MVPSHAGILWHKGPSGRPLPPGLLLPPRGHRPNSMPCKLLCRAWLSRLRQLHGSALQARVVSAFIFRQHCHHLQPMPIRQLLCSKPDLCMQQCPQRVHHSAVVFASALLLGCSMLASHRRGLGVHLLPCKHLAKRRLVLPPMQGDGRLLLSPGRRRHQRRPLPPGQLLPTGSNTAHLVPQQQQHLHQYGLLPDHKHMPLGNGTAPRSMRFVYLFPDSSAAACGGRCLQGPSQLRFLLQHRLCPLRCRDRVPQAAQFHKLSSAGWQQLPASLPGMHHHLHNTILDLPAVPQRAAQRHPPHSPPPSYRHHDTSRRTPTILWFGHMYLRVQCRLRKQQQQQQQQQQHNLLALHEHVLLHGAEPGHLLHMRSGHIPAVGTPVMHSLSAGNLLLSGR